MREIYDRYEDFNSMTKKELQLAVQTLSKTANQRLRSIEKAGLTDASNAYKYVESKFYDKDSSMDTTKKGEMKFKTTTKGRSIQELRKEVGQLREYLFNTKTSTVSGTNRKYQKGYETWLKRHPDSKHISRNEFGQAWSQLNVKRMKSMFGSDEVLEILASDDFENLTMDEIDNIFGQIADSYEKSGMELSKDELLYTLKEEDENKGKGKGLLEEYDFPF